MILCTSSFLSALPAPSPRLVSLVAYLDFFYNSCLIGLPASIFLHTTSKLVSRKVAFYQVVPQVKTFHHFPSDHSSCSILGPARLTPPKATGGLPLTALEKPCSFLVPVSPLLEPSPQVNASHSAGPRPPSLSEEASPSLSGCPAQISAGCTHHVVWP